MRGFLNKEFMIKIRGVPYTGDGEFITHLGRDKYG